MIQITEDLVLGARFTVDRSGGVMLRLFEVSGLAPGKDTLAQAAAAQDGNSGSRIPRYGDPHPAVAGLFVVHVDAEPIKNSRTSAHVKVQYATPEHGSVPNVVRVSISGSSRSKLISKNPADGSQLVVKYTDPSGNVLQEFLQVPALSPNTILQFIRQELTSPLKRSMQFRGKSTQAPGRAATARPGSAVPSTRPACRTWRDMR